MFVTVTRVQLPKERLDRMAEAFRQGARDLKQFPGFLGFELWRNDDTLEAVSRWESREAMEAYSRSDAFRAHHGRGATEGAAHPMPGQIEYFDGEVVV